MRAGHWRPRVGRGRACEAGGGDGPEQLSGGGAGLRSEVGRRRATEVWVRLLQAVGGTGPSPRVPVAPRGRGSGNWTSGGTAGTATTWAPRVSPAHRPWGVAGPRPTTIFSWPQASNTRGDNGEGRGSEAAPFLYKDRGATQVQADTTGCGACFVLPQASPGLPEGKQGRPAHRSAASRTIRRDPDSPGDCFAVQLWEHRWLVLKCRFLGAGPERKSAALATAP